MTATPDVVPKNSPIAEEPDQNFLRRHVGLLIVCLLFFTAGLLRLNDYSFLTPDSSLYLIWGNSVAHGHGFVDYTQPIPDRFVSRGVFYSILIAPVETIFPHSLTAVKVFTLLLGVLAVCAFYFWLSQKLGRTAAIAGTILLACNPLLLIYGTEVLSEIPFLCFVLLSTILIERVLDFPDGDSAIWAGFGLGLSLAAVALLRDIGMTFLITALLSLVIFRRWKQILPVIMLNFLFVGLWFVRNKYLIHQNGFSQSGYMPWFLSHVGTPESAPFTRELWWRITTSGSIYVSQFGGTLLYPLFATRQFVSLLPSVPHPYAALETSFPLWSRIVIVVALPLILFGIFRDIRSYRSGWFRIAGIFLYLGIVLCFPFNDIRYHVPLLPFFVYYIAGGARFIGEITGVLQTWFTRRRITWIAVISMMPNVLGTLYIVSNNIAYMQSPTQPWPAMGAWISTHLPEDAVIACPVKDLAPEIGTRKLINIDPSIDRPEFERILRENSVTCIVSPMLAEGGMSYEFSMRESARFAFDTLHTAGALKAWGVHNALQVPVYGMARNEAQVGDQSERHAPILAARSAILNGRYEDAKQLLHPIATAQPDRADVLYQELIAASFLRDTTEVSRLYNAIVSLPSWSGIYIAPTQRHMSALNTVITLHQSHGIAKPLRASEAAAMYWRMGYPQVAARLMNETTLPDSTYFVGLLWGMHYNLQSGDTSTAREYLNKLHAIDRTNAVVLAFDSVFARIMDIQSATSATEASNQHLAIARIYQAMELPEEALDEADRAIGLDERNDSAMILLAQIFESHARYFTAGHWYRSAVSIAPSNNEAQKGLLRVQHLLSAQSEQ